MMTEEQKRKERLIDLICLTCVDVRNVYSEDAAQDKINEVRALAEQLSALTQPASPALKLPDFVLKDGDLVISGHGGGWNECLAEIQLLNTPHTAQIEPICATGGAEWVKVPRELTAENGAKYVLSAEFFVGHTITCHECAGDGCEDCGEKGQLEENIMIDWPTIKEIWRRGINHFCPPSDSTT